jgi:hypothetical protein
VLGSGDPSGFEIIYFIKIGPILADSVDNFGIVIY